MKILITGASGFIGGFLVKEALRRGYETWAGDVPQAAVKTYRMNGFILLISNIAIGRH